MNNNRTLFMLFKHVYPATIYHKTFYWILSSIFICFTIPQHSYKLQFRTFYIPLVFDNRFVNVLFEFLIYIVRN